MVCLIIICLIGRENKIRITGDDVLIGMLDKHHFLVGSVDVFHQHHHGSVAEDLLYLSPIDGIRQTDGIPIVLVERAIKRDIHILFCTCRIVFCIVERDTIFVFWNVHKFASCPPFIMLSVWFHLMIFSMYAFLECKACQSELCRIWEDVIGLARKHIECISDNALSDQHMSIFIIAKFEDVLLHTRIRPVVEEWPLVFPIVDFEERCPRCFIISELWIAPVILGSGASIIFPHLRCHLTLGVRHHFFDYLAFLISHIYLLDCNVDRLIFVIVTDTALLHHIDRDQSCICRLYLDVRTTARQEPRCLVGNRVVVCRGRIVACCIVIPLQLLALRRITAICGERRFGIIEEFMEYIFFRLTAISKVTISVSILLEFMSFP